MNTELLSPAGSIEAGYAALYYGADAVYLGLPKFSARAEAINFSESELNEFVSFAHYCGKKVYVALNTVIQEHELNDVLETIKICDKYHVDALIVQDLGVARIVRKSFPNLALHASTQMAVHNLEGALALKKLGFVRVVLARELTCHEIEQIQKQSGMEIEVFIHGALCYSYSGDCFFSSFETGRSANRGKCAYPCRGLFEMGSKRGHLFSMKDLALEKDVLKLKNVSLKIEGRKKTALYVAAVTDYYRRILDTGKVPAGLTDHLKQIFARPWTKLYFNSSAKSDVIDPDFVGHRGLNIGRVEKMADHAFVIKTTRDFERFDGIQIDIPGMAKPYGFSVGDMTVHGRKVFTVKAGQTVMVSLPQHHPFISAGMDVYLASSTRVKNAYPFDRPKAGQYKKRFDIEVEVFCSPDKIVAVCGAVQSEISGCFEPAQNPVQADKSIHTAFEKTGNTDLNLAKLVVHNDGQFFIPMSTLNELRRMLYDQIKPVEPVVTLPPERLSDKEIAGGWLIKTDRFDCLDKVDLSLFKEVIVTLRPDFDFKVLAHLKTEQVRLSVPMILRTTAWVRKVIAQATELGYTKFEIGHLGVLELLPKKADVSFDTSIYMLNTQALSEAFELGARYVTLSVEDTVSNIRMLCEREKRLSLVVYQDVPLFTSANCIRPNNCADCTHQPAHFELKQKGKKYLAFSQNCQTTVVSQKAFCIAGLTKDIPASFKRIDFCHKKYSPDEVQKIVATLLQGQDVPNTVPFNFTRGFC